MTSSRETHPMAELPASILAAGAGLSARGIRRLSLMLALTTFVLIGLGCIVNSTGSGLSVPDWPTTYGRHLFLYPPSEWRGGILYEHTHRLVAALVGLLAFVHVLWSWLALRDERFRWFRQVSLVSFLLVILQGVLGGMTVLFRLPTAISTSHAMVAQSFFAITLLLALGTQRTWYVVPDIAPAVRARILRLSAAVWLVTFVQIFFGALTRHTYSALAIPDFPLVFGGLFPPAEFLSSHVLVHYLHRVAGFALAGLMVWQGLQLRRIPLLGPWGHAGMLIVLGQLLLGGWVVWSFRAAVPAALHGIVGTGIWAINTVIFFQAWRWQWLARQQHGS